MAESRIHQESRELIPDPMLTRLTRTEYWIWDQSDKGNRISSDGRNTWNRAGLIPDPLWYGLEGDHIYNGSGIRCCDCGILTAIVQVAMYGRHDYKARMSSPPAQNNNWSL